VQQQHAYDATAHLSTRNRFLTSRTAYDVTSLKVLVPDWQVSRLLLCALSSTTIRVERTCWWECVLLPSQHGAGTLATTTRPLLCVFFVLLLPEVELTFIVLSPTLMTSRTKTGRALPEDAYDAARAARAARQHRTVLLGCCLRRNFMLEAAVSSLIDHLPATGLKLACV
jgi:hypothetical protein